MTFCADSPWLIHGIVERLKKLHENGMSFSQIAETLNSEFDVKLTRHACIGKSHRLKLANRPTPMPPLHRPTNQNRPKPTLVKIVCDPIPIEWLGHDDCRYPISELHDRPPYLYCGRKTFNDSSWCQAHYKKCFVGLRRA